MDRALVLFPQFSSIPLLMLFHHSESCHQIFKENLVFPWRYPSTYQVLGIIHNKHLYIAGPCKHMVSLYPTGCLSWTSQVEWYSLAQHVQQLAASVLPCMR